MAVFVGGTAGTLVRAGVAQLWSQAPWATLTVNVLGAALLGLLLGTLHRRPDKLLHRLIGVGLLGSLTTFSTFALEVVELAAQSSPAIAAAYLGGSIFLGLHAALTGYRVGHR